METGIVYFNLGVTQNVDGYLPPVMHSSTGFRLHCFGAGILTHIEVDFIDPTKDAARVLLFPDIPYPKDFVEVQGEKIDEFRFLRHSS